MIKSSQLVLLILLLALPPLARGQSVPAAKGPAFYTGFSLPDVSGTLHYSLTASKNFPIGADNTNYSNTTNLSGNVGYLSASTTHPFSAVASVGYLISNSSQPSQFFADLSLSQVIALGRWRVVVADTVSYLPDTADGGLSGVPGLGDTNVPPITTGTNTGQSILTDSAQRVSNTVSGTIQRSLTPRTTLFGTGAQSLTRFLDESAGSTSDFTSYIGSGGLQHTLDARTSVGLTYSYGTTQYVGGTYGIVSQSLLVSGTRVLSRRLTVSGGVGPERITSSDAALVPSRISVSGNAGLIYTNGPLTSSLAFSRSSNSGGGVIQGAEATSASANAGRQFGRAVHASITFGYTDSTSLQVGAFNSQSLFFGGQVNRSILKHLSGFLSYSAGHQLNSGTNIPGLAFSGLAQTLSVGITYAPDGINLGR